MNEVLGLGAQNLEDIELEEDESSSISAEGNAIDTIATRIIDALNQNDSIKPKTWNDVLRGLELVLKFRAELKGKQAKDEKDAAYQALEEFKEVISSFAKK